MPLPPPPLRLACRLELLPGDALLDQAQRAKDFGFDAISLPGRQLNRFRDDLRRGADRLPLPLSSLSLGFAGSLLSAEPERRAACRASLSALFEWCRHCGIPVLNMPPALAQDNPEPLVPAAQRDALLAEQLLPLAEASARNGVALLLEPVNRYESDYLHTLEHAAALCRRVAHPALGVTADLFHMQIEEYRTPEALQQAGDWLRCLHVADNTREEPGCGSLAFVPAFAALQATGFKGFVELESRTLSGPAERVLPVSVEFLRRTWAEAAEGPAPARAARAATDPAARRSPAACHARSAARPGCASAPQSR